MASERCDRCGEVAELVDAAPPGEAGDVIRCPACDGTPGRKPSDFARGEWVYVDVQLPTAGIAIRVRGQVVGRGRDRVHVNLRLTDGSTLLVFRPASEVRR